MGSKGAIGKHFILSDRSFLRRSYLANRTAFRSVAYRAPCCAYYRSNHATFFYVIALCRSDDLCGGNATADSSHLRGTYGFAGSDACLYASGGFNARLQALGTTFSASNAAEGVRTFNGNGTGTFTSRATSITVPPTVGFLPAASSSENSARFTYTVNDDSFTSENVPGTNKGTVLTGPRAGQTFTVDGVPKATGLISLNGHTLTTSILTPGVETITYSNGDVEHRICHRSRVYIKLDAD